MIKLTPTTHKYFEELCDASFDWSGTPLFEGSDVEKGYLTSLKKNGLVRSYEEDNCTWVIFEDAGYAYAAEHNLELDKGY